MARRSFLRRVIDGLLDAVRREEPLPSSPPISPGKSTPGTNSLRRQAVDNIRTNLPMVNVDTVSDNVKHMTIDELRWTVRATADQLRWRARQDADRITSDLLPMNPWWYH